MASGSDDFNRANAATPGANWTEGSGGGASIVSNELSMDGTGFAHNWINYNAASLAADQYAAVKIVAFSGVFPQITLRYTDGSTPFYAIEVNGSTVDWYRYATHDPGGAALVQSQSLAFAAGDTAHVTIAGTGTSTVIRFWKNATGLPSAADTWNGDNTPDLSFTTDPASAVNSGVYAGLGTYQNTAGQTKFDDWFVGDFAGAAAGHPAAKRFGGVPYLGGAAGGNSGHGVVRW